MKFSNLRQLFLVSFHRLVAATLLTACSVTTSIMFSWPIPAARQTRAMDRSRPSRRIRNPALCARSSRQWTRAEFTRLPW